MHCHYLDRNFWQVVWVPETSCDVEHEVLAELYYIVSQANIVKTILCKEITDNYQYD